MRGGPVPAPLVVCGPNCDTSAVDVIKDQGVRAPMPPFTEEHEELRDSVRRFVTKEIAPHIEEWEDAREFPRELYTRCGELGFLGCSAPPGFGRRPEGSSWLSRRARPKP